jgi:hypothetical protein
MTEQAGLATALLSVEKEKQPRILIADKLQRGA